MKENLKQALNLAKKEFTHSELVEHLKTGSVLEKQISALNLKCVNSKAEAHLLVQNLVGVDGKIREAVAFKIHELLFQHNLAEMFNSADNYETFAMALIDIDSNVCRLVLDIIEKLQYDSKFSEFMSKKLVEIIKEVFEEVEKFTFRDKKYKINKQVFKLYWSLSALNIFYKNLDFQELKQILIKASQFSEYTIREKCMKILPKLIHDEDLNNIYLKLLNDDNYYVRNS